MRSLINLFCLFLLPLALFAEGNPFSGFWKPNLEATIERAKTMPDYKPEDEAKLRKIAGPMFDSMRLEITDTDLSMSMGKSRKQTFPSTIVSASESEVICSIQASETKTFQMKFIAIAEDRIRMESEAGNDMDSYVWEPAESGEPEALNTAAVVAAAMAEPAAEERVQEVRSVARDKSIQNNLRQIKSAADQYFLENGVTEVSYSKLEGEYFKKIKPVNGENYSELTLKFKKPITVTDKDGIKYTYE